MAVRKHKQVVYTKAVQYKCKMHLHGQLIASIILLMQCNKYDAQRTFLEQIISGQNKVALIGCGCSLATEPVAEISRFWNITHVSVYCNTKSLLHEEGWAQTRPLFIVSTKFHTHVVLSVDSVLSRHDVCTDIVTSCEVPLSMVRHWEPSSAFLIRL